ncbi:hypothetical protein [Butyrivibrio sp. WCE2006]|uniref:hypothetical protein n=1 Tax=Butyrivibrio sp. WCE2006 TaxID=1410611 RepID=UPI0005D18CF0|nr:hypothetical protein [Butyrivibrio sp. WCE2006]
MKKTKIFKTLIGTVLTFALTFAAVPQTASAAAYSSDKINTSAQAGQSYTIKTYFPGIGFQKVKVNFSTVSKEDGYYRFGRTITPAKKAQVVMRCSLPKATQNKIKNNVVKIYKASKYHYANNKLFSTVMDANTGIAFNNSNLAGKLYEVSSYTSDSSSKVFRQTAAGWRVNYTIQTNVSINYDIIYPSQNEGNILVGTAGASKEVSSNSTKITNFMHGNTPITNSVMFKKKMKNLSIWTRL